MEQAGQADQPEPAAGALEQLAPGQDGGEVDRGPGIGRNFRDGSAQSSLVRSWLKEYR